MENPIISLIEEICREKKISKEKVLGTLEQALAAAYRKDFGEKNQNIKAIFEPATRKIQVFDIKTVIADLPEEEEKKEKEIRFNPRTDIEISQAKKLYPGKKLKIGDEIKTELPIPSDFGRIAAQTAKQVLTQRLKEIEKETIFKKYKQKENQVIEGSIQKRVGQLVLVDLEDVTALLPPQEQIYGEKYSPGQRFKFYVLSVQPNPREPEVILSRRHSEILRQLFASEIPEIASDTVKIKKIAREPGWRSKVAVYSKEKNLDAAGACIGQRGIRIQTISGALNKERIDIIEYNDDPKKFIPNALSPAKISSLKINEKEKTAIISVPENQISLVIGKKGLNLRLASELTGYRIQLQQEKKEKPSEDKKSLPEDKKQEKPSEDKN